MRVVSWNVNGIRAGVRHGFVDFVDRSGADIVGVQEVRARPEDIPPAARRPPGSLHQIRPTDGAELWPDEDTGAAIGVALAVAALGADPLAGPRLQ